METIRPTRSITYMNERLEGIEPAFSLTYTRKINSPTKDAEYFQKVVAHTEARERRRLAERLSGHLNYEERREYLTDLIRGMNR